jgi:hypothetical protein
MSVLVAAAIIAGGTSLCLTTVSYVGIKFAKWSAEREDAKEKAYREEQQKLIDDEKKRKRHPNEKRKWQKLSVLNRSAQKNENVWLNR